MRCPKMLIEFMELHPTEDACRQVIFEHRWPHGFRCRRCGHTCAWYLRGRGFYECASCHYQGSLTAGTIFSCTRTDLRKWFLAIWLLASTKKAPSVAELSRQLGASVKTAWLMRRKIAHAMGRRQGELLLRGIVELDEGFLGGKRRRPASRGRRQPGKTMVAAAAEQTRGGGLGCAHLRVLDDASAASLSAAARTTIAADSVVQTDGWNGYADLKRAGYGHRPRRLPTGAEIDSWLPWVAHRALQLQALDRWISSTASAPPTYRPISTSTATGSTAANSAKTSFNASSTAAFCTPTPRPIRCSQVPERRGAACAVILRLHARRGSPESNPGARLCR